MRNSSTTTHSSDIIVVGSGIAGLYFALLASKYATVNIVTKKELMESNSNYAQGGIAAVLDPLDNYQAHINDTLIAGAHINNRKAVELLVREAPRHIKALIKLGVGFNHINSVLELAREGGHSKRRIVHAKDTTGREVERALIYNARNHTRINTFESHYGIELTKNQSGEVNGLTTINRSTGKRELFSAKIVVLATGGAGQVFLHTTNPKIATGDGIAMAVRAGAQLSDMEFVQFHPTTLNLPHTPNFLLSEALRGEGARLLDHRKRRFMAKYDKRADLAPRDIVSRAVFQESQRGPVYLDITHKPKSFITSRFPYIYEALWWNDLRMERDSIPIAPAAHYMCGGVTTDLFGRTSLSRVYAIGETAATGVHGANRLASNSILECLVFADRAQRAIRKQLPNIKKSQLSNSALRLARSQTHDRAVYHQRQRIRSIMWQHAGIVRTLSGLKKAQLSLQQASRTLHSLKKSGITVQLQETINMCTVAEAIVQAALARPHSIGCHFIE